MSDLPARRPSRVWRNVLIGVLALVLIGGAGGGYAAWSLASERGAPRVLGVGSPLFDPAATPSAAPTASVEPSASPSPSARPSRSASPKPSPKPAGKLKSVIVTGEVSGSRMVATVIAKVTGYGPVKVLVTFTYATGDGVESRAVSRTVTVTAVGAESIKTATASVDMSIVCAHPDTALGPYVGLLAQPAGGGGNPHASGDVECP